MYEVWILMAGRKVQRRSGCYFCVIIPSLPASPALLHCPASRISNSPLHPSQPPPPPARPPLQAHVGAPALRHPAGAMQRTLASGCRRRGRMENDHWYSSWHTTTTIYMGQNRSHLFTMTKRPSLLALLWKAEADQADLHPLVHGRGRQLQVMLLHSG